MSKWYKRLLELIGDVLIIAFGAFSLHLFIPIIFTGSVLCYEDNKLILFTEASLAVAIIALGVDRLLNDLKDHVNRKAL